MRDVLTSKTRAASKKPSPSLPKVFTILVTYNSTKWLDRVFDTLKAQGLLGHTIVVDNNSSDGTPDIISQKWPEVNLKCSTENLGFGAGNNLGISMALQAGADYVFLLNHDAWPVRGSIEKALEALVNNPLLGIVSPLHVQGDEHTADQLFARYLTQGGTTFKEIVQGELVVTVPFINAAAWIIPRSTLEQVGGFSPLFYHYGEDRDYVERIHFHGLQLGVIPGYTIIHDRGSRAEGWEAAPERQVNAFKVGLLQRLSNPNGTALGRILSATAWWLGNLKTAISAGYWAVIPPAIKVLGTVVIEHHMRAAVRKEVRKAGSHFITP